MPWRKKDYYPKSPRWVTGAGAILAVLLGVLIGYTRWGATASVVEIVEQQLTRTQTRIEVLEGRLGAIEGKLGLAKTDESIAPTNTPNRPTHAQSKASQGAMAPVASPR